MKIYAYTFAAMLSISACWNKQSSTVTAEKTEMVTVALTAEQLKNSEITVEKLNKKSIAAVLKVNGVIDVPPHSMVAVTAPLGGYLKSTRLMPGMYVSKGEILATLEDMQYVQLQQEFLTAKANYSSLEKEFVRQKELNASKAGSDKVFEKTQSEYLSQKVLIRALSEKLRLININPDRLTESNISRAVFIQSPITGFVSSVKVNVGRYIAPTDVMFELVNPNDIHLALTVFEKDLDKLSIGQSVVAYNNNNALKKYNAEIILIGKDITSERSITAHCHFDNYDKQLLPGMFMNAEISTPGASEFVIPNDGIVRFEGKPYVFVQTEERMYRMQEVTVLNSDSGLTQIRFPEGLNPETMMFAVHGAYTLLMKMKNTAD